LHASAIMTGAEWPAARRAIDAARRFLRAPHPRPTVIAADRDVDGLSAAVLLQRGLARAGRTARVVPARRGEHAHLAPMRARLAALDPGALIVVDMGSRDGTILAHVPTLVLDHHQPRGLPSDAIVVSAFGHPPVAPTSLLTWHVLRGVVDVEDLAWLALLGAVADLGTSAALAEVPDWLARHGRHDTTEAVALLNAARRAAEDAVDVALRVLQRAGGPRDIATGAVDGVARLRSARRDVQAEVRRCARSRPRFADGVALLRFASPMQVHPLVAVRWSSRLRDHIVIAANDGFVPGRVNFAMRTRTRRNLVDLLRALELGAVDGELGFGHPAATGGSLAPADFARLLQRLGFGAGKTAER
jgi:hypothetical protein